MLAMKQQLSDGDADDETRVLVNPQGSCRRGFVCCIQCPNPSDETGYVAG